MGEPYRRARYSTVRASGTGAAARTGCRCVLTVCAGRGGERTMQNRMSKIRGALLELVKDWRLSWKDLSYLLWSIGGTWVATFAASVAEGNKSVVGSVVAAAVGVLFAGTLLLTGAVATLLVDKNGKLSRAVGAAIGVGGMPRNLESVYLVMQRRMSEREAGYREYKDSRRWLREFFEEAKLVSERDLRLFTRMRYRKMVREVRDYETHLTEYKESGRMLREIKYQLLDGAGGWRRTHPGEAPDEGEYLAVVRGWYEPEEAAGAYLNEYALAGGGRAWLVRAEGWLIETISERRGWGAGREPEKVAVGKGEPDHGVGEIWDKDPSGFLHHPGRALRAARKLSEGRQARSGGVDPLGD